MKKYFEMFLSDGEIPLAEMDLKTAAIKYYEFMKQIIKYLTKIYANRVYNRALEYGNWDFWRKEKRYGLDIAYHAIRKEMEKQGLTQLSESLALAWKSAKELQREQFYEFLVLDEESIQEDIENIKRFWERLKEFVEE